MKNQKGITLLSLVVTIIILLILAAVTINLTVGEGGIFRVAEKAAIEQKRAAYKEELEIIILEEQSERYTTDKTEPFIQSLKNKIEQKEWVKEVLMCKENGEETENPEEATVLVIETIEGYGIIIDVKNDTLSATIREDSFTQKTNKIVVKYDPNTGIETEKIEPQEVKQGFSVTLKENKYTKTGYTFVGWCKDKNGEGEIYAEGSKLQPENDITMYAIWRQDVVTIRFDSNTGTGEMKEIIVEKGGNITLPENKFTKEENKFKCWNTNKEGTGTEYENGANITNITENITLYAKWEEIAEITVNLTGNSITIADTIEITVGGTAINGIKDVDLILGETTIYSKKDLNAKTYTKKLSLNDLENLEDVLFGKENTITLKITDNNGKTKEVSVDKVKKYLIMTPEDLNEFAREVNEDKKTFSGERIVLANDVTTTSSYIPIGYWDGLNTNYTGPYFAGTFEGRKYNETQNHVITITSMTTDSKYITTGVFGMTKSATINNLTVDGTNNSKASLVGGIVGGAVGGSINNCVNNCSMLNTEGIFKGGIVGGTDKNVNIYNCTNNAEIKGLINIGGICGNGSYAKITNCTNAGNVSSYGWENYDANNKICRTGGIVACADGSSEINGCTNTGTITAYYRSGLNNPQVGGIVGDTEGKVQRCKNSGTVQTSNFTATMTSGGLAGISGVAQNGAKIQECYNTGIVRDTSKKAIGLGGIVGEGYTIDIFNCYNTGSITGGVGIGGIAGGLWRWNNSGKCYVYNCYNSQTSISGTSMVGNIAGYTEYTYFDYCGWLGSQPLGGYSSSSVRNTFITRDSKFKFRFKR